MTTAQAISLDEVIVARVAGDPENTSYRSAIGLRELTPLMEQGISGATLKVLSDHIPRQVLISTVGSDKTNFTKLYRRTLSKNQTDEVNDLSLLWRELREFFDFEEGLLSEWVDTALPALSGEKPSNLMDTIFGRQAIRRCIDDMRYGEFG